MVACVLQRDLEEAVRTFCPVFYICDDDSFGHPCSFEFFIQHSTLVCSHAQCNRVLMDVGSVTLETLCDAMCDTCGERQQQLTLDLVDPDAKRGEKSSDIDDIPVYAHVKGILDANGEAYEALEITYITLFAHNGPYAVCPFFEVGAHDGDIEHITVRIDPTGCNLVGVWYNAHRNHDGCWVPGSQVSIEHGRLVSYIAKHGHGHYPTATTTYRHFFLGNDVTKKDVRWSPRQVVLLPTYDVLDDEVHFHHRAASKGTSIPDDTGVHMKEFSHENRNLSMYPKIISTDPCRWMHFRGFYGTAPAPIAQRWFHEAEPPVSRHPLLRLFFHFWPETVSL